MLTIVPAGAERPGDEQPQAAAWFPAIGMLFGAVAYAIIKAAALLSVQIRASYLVAILIVVTWGLLSRMRHWDGLARVTEASWGARRSERELETEPHGVGVLGIMMVGLAVAVEAASIGRIVGRPHELAVLLVPIVSHFAATATVWLGVPLPHGGLSRSVTGHPTTLAFVIGVVPLAGALTGMWIGYRTVGLVLGAFGVLLALGVPHLFAERFGGVTSDIMGASVLVTETALFAALALVV
jgi:adenosylcobinamide-GDP ribazoletransferase